MLRLRRLRFTFAGTLFVWSGRPDLRVKAWRRTKNAPSLPPNGPLLPYGSGMRFRSAIAHGARNRQYQSACLERLLFRAVQPDGCK